MKTRTRLVAFLLALLMALSMPLCTFAEDGATPPEQTVAATEAPTPKPTEKPTEVPATPEPTPTPSAAPAEEAPTASPTPVAEEPTTVPSATPAPFEKGLVKLAAGVCLYADRDLTNLLGTLVSDGVAYATVESGATFAAIAYVQGSDTLHAYAAASAIHPLSEAEIAAYTAQHSDVAYEGLPLFPLSLTPAEEDLSLAGENAALPFTEGAATLSVETMIFADAALTQPIGRLTAEGVAYLLPIETEKPLAILYTADGETLAEGYLAADAAVLPLADPDALAAYLAQESTLAHENIPLFPLAIEPYISYEMATYGLPGMPYGYVLTDAELAEKALLTSDGTLAQLSKLTPGKDYVADEVLLSTDSREYAELVAASYAATVSSLTYGLAVLKLDGVSVLEAITAATDMDASLAAVRPNYYYKIEPQPKNPGAKYSAKADLSLLDSPSLKTWADMKGTNEFLQNPGDNDKYQYMHDVVGSYGAWGLTKGAGARVGVIDTGVRTSHEDLGARITSAGNNGGADADGHGTHVTGIIAAGWATNKGGAGIAPESTVYSYNASSIITPADGSDPYTAFATADLITAVNDLIAEPKKVQVINMSVGGIAYDHNLELTITNAIENNGVAIIAAAGNDGGMVFSYPAGYAGVISVAATDGNNMRAPYSNYGSATLAAPGSYIYSTSYSGNSAYESLHGTSMAAPVVTGVAALYYSAKKDSSGSRDLNGDGQTNGADVAELKKALTGSCFKPAGTSPGMGAGIVNATNLFKKVVGKPGFQLVLADGTTPYDGVTASAVPSNARIKIDAGFNGSYIVYTVNGTTPSVKNGVVVGEEYSSAITLSDAKKFPAGKYTIKALSVNAQGVSSTVASYSFTIENTVTGVAIEGSEYVAKGKSAIYTAVLTPVSKSIKPVWEVTAGSATISAGKLTVAANAVPGSTVKIKATAGGIFSPEFTVTVTAFPVKAILLDVPSLPPLRNGETSALITPSATLTDGSTPDGMSYAVTSANIKVATVAPSGTGWQVTGVAPGKTSITFAALDGSGKKAILPVTVYQQVTSLSIEGGANAYIVAGKTKALKAAILPTKADKNLIWSVDAASAALGVTITKGTLAVPAAVPADTTITVTCEPNYGTTPGVNKSQTITVLSAPFASVSLTNPNNDAKVTTKSGLITGATLFTVSPAAPTEYDDSKTDASINKENELTLGYSIPGVTLTSGMAYFTSSNPNVATVDTETGVIKAISAGKATITCIAGDGSGKKASAVVTVIVPVSHLHISPDTASMSIWDGVATIGFGKSIKIAATYGATYGKPTIQKATWKIKDVYYWVDDENTESIPESVWKNYVKISSTGALTAKLIPFDDLFVYQIDVEATSADKTQLSATCTFLAQPAVTAMTAMNGVYGILDDYGYDEYDFTSTETVYSQRTHPLDDNLEFWSEQDAGAVFFFYTDSEIDDYSVTSSNPAVAAPIPGVNSIGEYAGALVYKKGKLYYLCALAVVGNSPGTAKITVRSNDGSKKSCSFTVRVYP